VPAAPLYEGEGTTESPYIVKFRKSDNGDPMQWTELTKWLITANVAFSTLCVVSRSFLHPLNVLSAERAGNKG